MHERQVPSLGQQDPGRAKWQPAPVLLPGEFHRQRSLAGYSPWGHKDITEQLSLNTSTSNKELGDASIPKIGKTMHFHLWPQVPGHQPLTEPELLLFPFYKQGRHKRILILFLALQLR